MDSCNMLQNVIPTSQPNVVHPSFEIISLIIDIIGKYEDINLSRELALVSYSFLHICSKHFFAAIELYDNHDASVTVHF